MKPGDKISILAKVVRVDGERVDAQTPNGQLIQTHKSNVEIRKPAKESIEASGKKPLIATRTK